MANRAEREVKNLCPSKKHCEPYCLRVFYYTVLLAINLSYNKANGEIPRGQSRAKLKGGVYNDWDL